MLLLANLPKQKISIYNKFECKITKANNRLMQVSISSITIPRAPPEICTKHLPPPWGFCILAFARGGGGGDLLGLLLRGGHLSVNDFCYFWNFHYNGKNWRLTTLWGLFVSLKFYVLKENYSILD